MTDLESKLPHEVSEVICLKCLQRWIAVYPQSTPLKMLECKCGEVGYVIKTGQTISESTECVLCKHYYNEKCKLGLHHNNAIACEYYKE